MKEKKNRNLIEKLRKPTHSKRLVFFIISDTAIMILSLYLAFKLRFDFNLPPHYKDIFVESLPLFVAIKLACLGFFRLYSITWRFVSINDLTNLIKAILLSELLLMSIIFNLDFFHIEDFKGFPRSIFIIDGLLSLVLSGGLRISKRVFFEVIRKKDLRRGKRTLIIGAGNTGEMILRDLLRQNLYSSFYPVGFLDDDPRKLGTYIHNVKVMGKIGDLKEIARKNNIEAVIISIPSMDYKTLRNIYENAREVNINIVKIIPRIYNYSQPDISVKSLEDIGVEDLIGRKAINVDYEAIRRFLDNKSILITGAGGSIGSEIAVQVCSFNPKKVILFDIDETDLFNLEQKLKLLSIHQEDKKTITVVGDICDVEKLSRLFKQFKPNIVFHAAAYKHVPMMEVNPEEAVKVNVFGTYNIAQLSSQHGIEKFVFISTDKAVNPTNIMGATKRLGEYITQAFNSENHCKFICVRFGNVLGSRGSVIPVWLNQLRHGGPLTVTHKDMKRYFMTIPEAVSLVLQASTIKEGGKTLVLDMGEPIRIVKLAEELIRLHGLKPYEDIDIEFTGPRPGEKLEEELFTAEEGITATTYEKILTAQNTSPFTLSDIENIVQNLKELIKSHPNPSAIRKEIWKYI